MAFQVVAGILMAAAILSIMAAISDAMDKAARRRAWRRESALATARYKAKLLGPIEELKRDAEVARVRIADASEAARREASMRNLPAESAHWARKAFDEGKYDWCAKVWRYEYGILSGADRRAARKKNREFWEAHWRSVVDLRSMFPYSPGVSTHNVCLGPDPQVMAGLARRGWNCH